MAKRRRVLGIDLGSRLVKVVGARLIRGRVKLHHHLAVPVPEGWMQQGVPASPQELGQLIQAELAKARIRTTQAVASLSAQSVAMRTATFPRLSDGELAKAVYWEIDQHLPIDRESAIIDHLVDETSSNSETVEVFLCGTQRRVVDQYIEALVGAGLDPVALEPDSLAIIRGLGHLGMLGTDQRPVAVLDLGYSTTKLGIYDRYLPQVSRSINIAGRTLEEALRVELTPDQAKEALYQQGLSGHSPIRSLVEPAINSLFAEVRRSLEFYLVKNADQQLAKVFLIGGYSGIPGLAFALRDHLRLYVGERLPDDFTVAPVTVKGSPIFVLALGLALREEADPWDA
ncbi:MAG: type IV pilus assembly protein PilM [Bacillota bacterium]